MDANKKKLQMRRKRHRHVRKTLAGTSGRPRLCVFRSHKHIYAQVIDDSCGKTLLSMSSQSPELRDETAGVAGVEAAAKVGGGLGRRCLEQGIEALVFDRGGYKYHGRVKALADGVRKEYEGAGKTAF